MPMPVQMYVTGKNAPDKPYGQANRREMLTDPNVRYTLGGFISEVVKFYRDGYRKFDVRSGDQVILEFDDIAIKKMSEYRL